MGQRLAVTEQMVTDYIRIFVNRFAYTVASKTKQGVWSWRRPQDRNKRFLGLTRTVIQQHLEGQTTIGLYAINPKTQRCKWLAVDADYEQALVHLAELRYALKEMGVDTGLENSRRGGHLWMFAQTPLLGKQWRLLIRSLAEKLSIPVKGAGVAEGIEIFPMQDTINPEQFGNGMRGPLGVHQKSQKRYYFFGVLQTLEAQFDYIKQLPKLSEKQLEEVTAPLVPQKPPKKKMVRVGILDRPGRFNILDYVPASQLKKVGRNYVTSCPSCRSANKDRAGDNLSVLISDPDYYKCWADCSKEMIRSALGAPSHYR